MKIMIGAVVTVVPLMMLDGYFIGGTYTNAVVQMLSDIRGHFHHG